MNFLKDIFNKFRYGSSSERLGTISDIIQVITFFGAIILSPKILSLFYNLNSNNYFGIVFATMLSILIILAFLAVLLILIRCKSNFVESRPSYIKILYIALHVMLWGIGLAFVPSFIVFLYQMALK